MNLHVVDPQSRRASNRRIAELYKHSRAFTTRPLPPDGLELYSLRVKDMYNPTDQNLSIAIPKTNFQDTLLLLDTRIDLQFSK